MSENEHLLPRSIPKIEENSFKEKKNEKSSKYLKKIKWFVGILIVLLIIFFIILYIFQKPLLEEIFPTKIKKSINDKRNYNAFRLSNNLGVLLIEDKNISKVSASLSVNIGSFNNPDDFLGLAHFLEHMILRGSKAFPKF